MRRAELHAVVARAIEQLHADKLDERAALLAYHWEQAGEPLTAAQWHARAADVAGFDSPLEAVRHWESVWEILQAAPASDEGVALRLRAAGELLNFGWRVGMTHERAAQIFGEGKALAIERGDAREQLRLHNAFGLIHVVGGNPQRAIALFEESVGLADATGDPELRWSARTAPDFTLWLVGDLARAERMNDEQIALAEADPALGIATIGISTADSLWHRGVILRELGRFQEAAAAFQRADERALRFGENEMASWIDFMRADTLERAGDAWGALSMARRAIESAEKIGSVLSRVGAHASYGMACVLAEQWQSARESLDFALELGRSKQTGLFLEPYYVAALAEAHLGLGDGPRARQLAEEAHEIALRAQMLVAEVRALLAGVRVRLTLDGVDARAEVESMLDRALALVRSTGARSFEPQIHGERARLAGLLSDAPGREQWLREAHRLFIEMGATGHAERVARELS